MAERKIDLYSATETRPGDMYVVGGGDLRLFCAKLIAGVRAEFERQQELTAVEKAETFVTGETVKTKYDISESTLYRLAKRHVLEPVYIGGQRRYRLSDLERLTTKDSQ
jgi:hypothetical protein